jgi:serine/threonine protein kinase
MTTPALVASSAMKPGTRLGEFEITGVVGEGGFGIVYSALDSSLDRVVAVKEYLPAAFAGRAADGSVQVRSEEHTKTFAAGLASFINEARMLAKFSHPSLVEVFRFWEANGTAYMAMRYYRGLTLREMLRTNPQVATEQWLCETLDPILLALNELHMEECFHRDIAPDNILVLPNGRSVLMDFGAARRIIGGMTRALTTVLKPGYAPIEQYSDDGSMKQGAWTDVYAVGGLLYHAMTGKVPVQAISRMMNDPLKPVASLAREPYSENLCNVVMKCLAVMPENRFQSIGELRTALGWMTTTVSSAVMFGQTAFVKPTVTNVVDDTTIAVPKLTPRAQPSAPMAIPSVQSVPLDPLAQFANVPSLNQRKSTTFGSESDLDTVVGPKSKKKSSAPVSANKSPQPLSQAPSDPLPNATVATRKSNVLPTVLLGLAGLVLVSALGYTFLGKKKTPRSSSDLAVKTDVAPVGTPNSTAPAAATAPPASTNPVQSATLPTTSATAATIGATAPSPPVAVEAPSTVDIQGKQSPASGYSGTLAQIESADVKANAPPAITLGTIPLDIKPWGNVFVNGVAKGPSPPMKRLSLAPGTYTIEIKNDAGPSVVRTIEVLPGRNALIRHTF